MFQSAKERKVVSVMDVIQFMTHDSLLAYKKKGSKFAGKEVKRYEATINAAYKGCVFLSPTKEELSEGKGYVVTSYETLQEKIGHATHWTPNTFRGGTYYNFSKRIIKGHSKENLKQVNVMGFDMDVKDPDQIYRLYLACDELRLPRPNVLLETPRGFQCFFVLETPFYIHRKNDFKSLRVAERLSDNIRKALCKYVPVDTGCVPFGFYRMPREDNVLDFYDKPANTNSLLSWSREFEKQEKRSFLHVVYDQSDSQLDQTHTDWYRALINAQDIDKGHTCASRNNALMTLALANYASNRPFEEAYDELDQFNSNLARPLSKSEFERTLKSAYSGKYKGVKRSYVDGLLELWTNGKAQFQGKEGWYKFKKNREERVRSHYEEWEEDILAYIEQHMSPEKPFLEGSLSTLAKTFGIALSSLKEVLKRSGKLIKRTVGRGRGAVTKLSSRIMLFRSLLHTRKEQIQHAQLTLAELLPNPYPFPNGSPLVFPTLDSQLINHEVDILYGAGSSPPDQRTS